MQYRLIAIRNIVKYLAGFLLIYVSSIWIARTAEESVRSYVFTQAETRVKEGIHTVEESVEKMNLIQQMVCQNPDFTSLIYSGDDSAGEKVLKVKDSSSLLVRTGYMTEFTPYMFVLFRKNDIFLSSVQCSLRFSDYYNQFFQLQLEGHQEMTGDEIRKTLFEAQKDGTRFFKLSTVFYMYNGAKQTADDALLYLAGNGEPGRRSLYLFGFLINQDFLAQTILIPELENQSFLSIQDQKSGEIILTIGTVPDGALNRQNGEFAGENAQYQTIVNEENTLQWRIVTGVPSEFVQEQMRPVKQLLKWYLIAGFLIMICFTMYYAAERYFGFKKIMTTITGGKRTKDSLRTGNEYGIIHQGVMQLNEKGKDYELQIGELKKQNAAILLESMIVKGVYTDSERKIFEEKIGTVPEFYCVCLVHLMMPDLSLMEGISIGLKEKLAAAGVNIFANVHSGASDELYVIEISSQQEASASDIEHVFESAVQALTAEYGVVFHVGISTVGTGITNLNQCYEQARRIVQAQNTFEDKTTVSSYDISVNALHENPVTLECLNHLYTLLVCGQQVETERELKRIHGFFARYPYLYASHKEQVFYSLRNIFYSVILHLNWDEGEKIIPAYEKHMSNDELLSGLTGCAKQICDYIAQGKKSKNERLKEKILQCIQDGFRDPAISAASVSAEAGISEKYLAQFLKEQTGETFAAYLLNMRIASAKKYLQETDLSNEQIAEQVGFGTVNTFYRNFKKIVGVTPNIYRENPFSEEK